MNAFRFKPAVAGGLAAAVLAVMLPQAVLADDASPAYIAVTGKGETRAVPDEAVVQLAVEIDAETAAEASDASHEVARALLRRIRELGIAEKDIQSTAASLQPRYQWDEKRREQKRNGFRSRRDVTVTVRDLDRLPRLIAAAGEAGVSHISPPQLQHSRNQALQREALQVAARDARAQAEAIAEGLGVALGSVMSAQSGGGRPPIQPMMARAASVEADSAEDLGMTPGEIVHRARLEVRFAIAD